MEQYLECPVAVINTEAGLFPSYLLFSYFLSHIKYEFGILIVFGETCFPLSGWPLSGTELHSGRNLVKTDGSCDGLACRS